MRRSPLNRTKGLERRSGLAPRGPKGITKARAEATQERRDLREAWWEQVCCYRDDDGDLHYKPCVRCGSRNGIQGAHIIPQRICQKDAEDLWWDARNGLPLCLACHRRHDDHVDLLPLSLVPVEFVQLCEERGLGWVFDKHYKENE